MAVASVSKSGGTASSSGTSIGSLIRDWGPTLLAAYSNFANRNASEESTRTQLDALNQAGQLQYQTALQAMELARLRDLQTRLDTEQSRFQGYNAMNAVARQLGLPVYREPFNRTVAEPQFGGLGGGAVGYGGPFGGFTNTPSSRAPSAGNRAASGAAQGASIGSAFGPWGTVIGGVIGGAAGYFGDQQGGDLSDGSRVFGTKNGTFFDSRGNVIARVPPPAPGEGLKVVPGISRNGSKIYIDEQGNLLKPNNQGKGYGTITNLNNLGDRPIEINGIIGKGYQPLPANDDELRSMGIDPARFSTNPPASDQSTIGIPSGETNSTGLIPLDGGAPTALDRYAGFQETPGYQFVMDEGLRAIDKRAASRGRYFGGGTQREGQRYATGLASQEYGNYFDRLMQQVAGGANAGNLSAEVGSGTTANAMRSLIGGASDLGATLSIGGAVRASGIEQAQRDNSRLIEGIAGSGVFDRLGTIFGGRDSNAGGGGWTMTPPNRSGAGTGGGIYNDPLSRYFLPSSWGR